MGEINNDSKKQPHVKETANSQRGDSLWSSTLVISAHNGDIVGSVENEQLERRLKWKLDLIILPILSTIYFFAAMGRTDLSNAKVAGMSDDLHLTPKQYSHSSIFLLIGYVLFQIPGTLLLKTLGPSYQFGGAMIAWGIVTLASVSIRSAGALYAVRFFIGAAEAFTDGAAFYLSFWYKYSELAFRGGIFFSTSSLAGACNGLIGYAINEHLDGAHGWRAWRWIFLVEGILPIFVGTIVMFTLPSEPEKVKRWFTSEEKEILVQRSRLAHNNPGAHVRWKDLFKIFGTFHFYLYTLMAFSAHYGYSTLGNFIPLILNTDGYSDVEAQRMSVVVYACGFVGTLFFTRLSDYTNKRALINMTSAVVAAIGYIILVAVSNSKAAVAGVCLATFGVTPLIVLNLVWAALNIVGYTRRGSTIGWLNIFSQLFSVAGNEAYDDPPWYRAGNASTLGLMAFYALVAAFSWWYFDRLNKRRDREDKRVSSHAEGLRKLDRDQIGDQHPDYVFTT